MKYLAVKDFERFQHYKDRSPAWIKLYNALLDDYAFLSLSDAARSHLILIWLIASRHDNRIPYDLKYITRALHTKGRIDLAGLIDAGFLIEVEQDASSPLAQPEQSASTDASKTLAKTEHRASGNGASRKHNASPRARPRARERERRGETEKNKPPSGGAGAPAESALNPDAANGNHPAPPTDQPAPPTTQKVGGGWPARFAARFEKGGHHYDPGRVGKALARQVTLYGEERLFQALECFLDDGVAVFDEKEQFITLPRFAEHAGTWVERVTPMSELAPEKRELVMRGGT